VFNFFKRKKKKDPRRELQDILGNFELPCFPSAVMNVLAMLRDPESSMTDIAAEIELDPGMHLKILRIVNSAGFGLAQKVSNLQHAVTIMGRSRLESLVLTFAVTQTMPAKIECMRMAEFWLGSARRACLARILAQDMHAATQAEAFTAGLLQDLAIPIIATAKQKIYKGLIRKWHADPEADLAVMERELFGYDHATVGALMAEDWELPEYLVNAIAGHHNLSADSPAEPAVRLVSRLKYFEHDDGSEQLLALAEKEYGLERAKMSSMMAEAFGYALQFAKLFD